MTNNEMKLKDYGPHSFAVDLNEVAKKMLIITQPCGQEIIFKLL